MGARERMSIGGREGVVPCSMFMIMREPCVLWNHLADEGLRRRCVDSLYVWTGMEARGGCVEAGLSDLCKCVGVFWRAWVEVEEGVGFLCMFGQVWKN